MDNATERGNCMQKDMEVLSKTTQSQPGDRDVVSARKHGVHRLVTQRGQSVREHVEKLQKSRLPGNMDK